MKKIRVRTSVAKTGLDLYTNQRKFTLKYPFNIWSSFPKQYKQVLAENLTVFFTQHLAFWKNYSIIYEFSSPMFVNMFFTGLLMSLPETTIEFEQYKHQTSSLIKKIFNSQFDIQYQSAPDVFLADKLILKKSQAIIPFTFGKDSLLTFALCQKIGLKPQLFFVEEPFSELENQHRRHIYKAFEKIAGYEINFINNSLGYLRQRGKEMWGWDMLQLQYAALLVPYAYKFNANYLFFSNEKNTNETELDPQGYIANLYFEQSQQWMMQLNHLYRYFGLATQIGSIISPIYELMVTYILHKNFPDIARFQISCQADSSLSKVKRWCGVCNECARMYLFLRAIGVDPQSVDFKEDLLNTKRYEIYHIFSQESLNKDVRSVVEYYGEWMLAFWLASIRGTKGHLISLFKKYYLKTVVAQKQKLINKYLSYHSDLTLPANLRLKIESIYARAVKDFKTEITAYF